MQEPRTRSNNVVAAARLLMRSTTACAVCCAPWAKILRRRRRRRRAANETKRRDHARNPDRPGEADHRGDRSRVSGDRRLQRDITHHWLPQVYCRIAATQWLDERRLRYAL